MDKAEMDGAEYGIRRIGPERDGVLPTPRHPVPPDIRLPRPPAGDGRGSGLFGLGRDRQALSNERRLRELHLLGMEAAYAGEMALGLELRGLKAIGEAMSLAERIVYAHPAGSLATMVAADLAGELAERSRLRHGRLMEAFDADAMNIIRRR